MPGLTIEYLIEIILSIPGVIIAFTMKGFGQTLVSKWLGDPTPEDNGRLTVNPLAHISWIGIACMVLLRFGWTKPMPTNSRYYKNFKLDTVLFCLSGPGTLVVTSFVMSFFYGLFYHFYYSTQNIVFYYIALAFMYATLRPLFLAVFYLLPLPGLDGYKIITTFTPYKWTTTLYKIERYSMFIFLGFILLMQFSNIGYYVFYPAYKLFDVFSALWINVFS